MLWCVQAAKAQGNLTLERVLELKEGGVEIGSLLTDDNRQQLYRGEVGPVAACLYQLFDFS